MLRRTALKCAIAAIAAGAISATLVVRAAQPQPLAVAAASDLQSVLPTIVAQFEKDTGQKVSVTFGSSGNFMTQIEHGAPFDVFLSADIDYPRRLEQAGLVEAGSVSMYATGRIVLWSRNDSKVDVSRGLAVVTDPQVRRIAVANPAHAPYGRAAVAALRHDHLYDEVRSKLVLGENISQAAQFAQSGNAEVGILALSLALSPTLKSAGRYFEIPASSYPPIEQAGAVVSASRQTALAHRFLAALKAPSAERTLGAFGFSVPTAAR